MQVSDFNKKTLLVTVLLFSISLGFAQVKMPEMPSMPEVSMPKIGDTHYYPTVPKITPKKKTSTTELTDDNLLELQDILTETDDTEDLLKKLITNSDSLTASDITSLYDTGRFTNLSSLTGLTSSNTSKDSTNVLLKKVLEELNELKTQQKNASAAQKKQDSNQQIDSQNFRKRNPSILRFRVNGYSITESLTEVFFSETEPDGTFLLTADRKYFVNQSPYTETFYLLFKSVKSTGAVTTYEVVPSIVQNKNNPNSFVYKLCQKKNITAEKTGNLVVLHLNGNDINADMLLDIDN